MIYLDLFLGFLRVGCFSFGGAYGSIPLIRDVVRSYGWISDEVLANMIAVSESTPGPIMVNMATYIGSNQGGILGAAIATFAVVLPAFLIILLLMAILRRILQNRFVQAALNGLKPCISGIILATGAYMIFNSNIPKAGIAYDWKTPVLTVILAALAFAPKSLIKKKISPIMLIVISAALGIVFYGI